MTYVWGVDLAMSNLAVAFAHLDTGELAVRTLRTNTDAREGERLGLIDRQVRIACQQWAGDYPPYVIWVEQPSGPHDNLPLKYCAGVIQAALFETLRVPVWTITSGMWKRRACGFGNASKAQVAAWVDSLHEVDTDSQDEVDAVAIAYAGRLICLDGRMETAA